MPVVLLTILKNHRGKVAVGAVIALLLLVIMFQRACPPDSAREQKLDQLSNEVIEKKAEDQVLEKKAEDLDTKAREDVKKAREARNDNKRGTTIEEANRNRCVAYPDDPGCK